jgi:L-threonylcarbamoyladenylate synthase
MRLVTVDPLSPDAATVREAARILRQGGLVAVPTETVYGLGALGTDAAAVLRIFAAKGRPATHALILHVLDLAAARPLAAEIPPLAERLAEAFWPGPLTMVLRRSGAVPDAVTGGGPTVALRAPAHPVIRALLRELGAPIAAPSANRYQSVSPTRASHVAKSLGDAVDLILDGGPCERGIESTVVDLTDPETPRVLRLGALSVADLRALAPGIVVDVKVGEQASGAGAQASPGRDARHYAPRGRIVFAPDAASAFDAATAARASDAAARIAVLLRRPPPTAATAADSPCLSVRVLGDDPVTYARNLFDALHEADDLTATLLIVESVPSAPAWAAVHDRLARAAHINET